MKHLRFILLTCISLTYSLVVAQTPFDSFSPETSRPMLVVEDEASMRQQHQEALPDSMRYAVIVDIQQQTVYLADLSEERILAIAPFTEEMRNWLSVDPLSDKYPNISPYAYCAWNPVRFIDPNGEDAILITFPQYRAMYKGCKIPMTGHSVVLLINNKTGLTKYYEYGRYGDDVGKARNVQVPNVTIENGRPTQESLNTVLMTISKKSGEDGDIEGAYVISDNFEAMNKYAEGIVAEASNPDRKEYNIFSNNCATFAEDVILQDESVDRPMVFIHTPINTVEEWQDNGNARVHYDSQTNQTTW